MFGLLFLLFLVINWRNTFLWSLYFLSLLGADFAMISIGFTIIASFYKDLTVFTSILTEVTFGLAFGATLGFWFLVAIWEWNTYDPVTKIFFTLLHSLPIIFLTINSALT